MFCSYYILLATSTQKTTSLKPTLKSGIMRCAKNVRIRIFSGPYIPAFGLNTEYVYSVRMRENTDLKNSEYGHFSRSDVLQITLQSLSVTFKAFKYYNGMKINTDSLIAKIS